MVFGLILVVIIIILIIGAALALIPSLGDLENSNSNRSTSLDTVKDFEADYQRFEKKMLSESGFSNLGYHKNLPDQFREVFEFFNPNQGWFGSWLKERQTEKQVRIVQNLNSTQKGLLDTATSIARAVMEQRRNAADFYMFMQQNYSQLQEMKMHIEFSQRALAKDMLPQDFSKSVFEELASKNKIKEHKGKIKAESKIKRKEAKKANKHKLRNEQQESDLKTQQYRDKVEIDTKNEIKLAHEQLRLDIISKHLVGQQKAAYIEDLIQQQYVKIAETKVDKRIPHDAKPDIINSRLGLIAMFREEQSGKERPLQLR